MFTTNFYRGRPADQKFIIIMYKRNPKLSLYYCPYCKKALYAAHIIASKGYPVMTLCGGYKIWHEIGFDTVKNASEADK